MVRKKTPQIVLVCGGRDYNDKAHVWGALYDIEGERPIKLIVVGDAKGADTLARGWATERDIPCLIYPAQWQKYGKYAGPKRNTKMLRDNEVDLVVAFPGGAGTADMVRQAKAKGINIVEEEEL